MRSQFNVQDQRPTNIHKTTAHMSPPPVKQQSPHRHATSSDEAPQSRRQRKLPTTYRQPTSSKRNNTPIALSHSITAVPKQSSQHAAHNPLPPPCPLLGIRTRRIHLRSPPYKEFTCVALAEMTTTTHPSTTISTPSQLNHPQTCKTRKHKRKQTPLKKGKGSRDEETSLGDGFNHRAINNRPTDRANPQTHNESGLSCRTSVATTKTTKGNQNRWSRRVKSQPRPTKITPSLLPDSEQ